MTQGRKADPTRKKRHTGNRPMPGEAKKAVAILPAGDPLMGDIIGLPGAFAPPEDLPEEAYPIWEQAVSELVPQGLKAADLEAIRMMCLAALRARQAAESISKYGIMVKGARGPMANPMLRVERDSTATYVRLAEQFGLTVAARLRLGLMQIAGQSMISNLNASLNE